MNKLGIPYTKVNNKGKRGLSNIVGSLLMIIITIVAALLLGHFVFGLFSSNSHNSAVAISDASIVVPGGSTTANAYVTITVTDSGNDPIQITQVQVLPPTGNAVTVYSSTATGATTVNLSPGQDYTFTYTASAGTFTVGQTVVVQVTAKDLSTGQTITQQMSIVVQD